MAEAQVRAKYATINKRKQLEKKPRHRAHILNAAPRSDQPPIWAVVCADCAHDWQKTNAYDHGNFRLHSEARAFVEAHNVIFRFIDPQRKEST